MDKELKQMLEDIFTHHCFAMVERGRIAPMSFIIKNSQPFPVVMNEDVKLGIGQYISCSLDIAKENNAEGLVMVSEQYMIVEKKDDKEIQELLTRVITPAESDKKKEYLVLSYTESDGKTYMLVGEIQKDDGGKRFVTNQKWTESAYNALFSPWKDVQEISH